MFQRAVDNNNEDKTEDAAISFGNFFRRAQPVIKESSPQDAPVQQLNKSTHDLPPSTKPSRGHRRSGSGGSTRSSRSFRRKTKPKDKTNYESLNTSNASAPLNKRGMFAKKMNKTPTLHGRDIINGNDATPKTGKYNIQQWPYDNFHEEQERMMERKLRALEDMKSYSSEEDLPGKTKEPKNQPPPQQKSLYERPAELPTIRDAVRGLSLVEFERTAETRAISIVETWLHDSGLIDELLAGAPSGDPLSTPSVDGGVELGVHGFPVGINDLKISKEIDTLRSSTRRDLSLINARLNDGVAASGSEVQELVHAVSSTRGDLGKLRDMTTYIAQHSSNSNDFILRNCPLLKNAIHARRNLFRCFQELDFFSQIPSTCERLREELTSGEWTTDEWNTIRSVSVEHVELEILLIEAEAGMKKKIAVVDHVQNNAPSGEDYNFGTSSHTRSVLRANYEAVDTFLAVHVKNVWELGDEIRMRILSGIGSSFDLALNNPAAMVALVEAVEIYERAAKQYKSLTHDKDEEKEEEEIPEKKKKKKRDGTGVVVEETKKERLRFTDMRASALAQIYQDFELRGLEVFRNIHMNAAEVADEDTALSHQFNAVLRAATELVSDIELVKSHMEPCFAPNWSVGVLWSSCVAHVCSNQILQQIGGPEGNNLTELSSSQLLDLIAWIEYFRQHIEEAFPQVATRKTTQKTYFDQRPELFAGEGKREVDMESATDSLAWVNNMLWEVHGMTQGEFLQRTRDQTNEWLGNVYSAEHTQNQTNEGQLTSSLCEDVFTLVSVQLRTLREHLSPSSEALVMAVCLIFSNLKRIQIQSRDMFLKDLETCCTAANDFTRMNEKCEEFLSEMQRATNFGKDTADTLEESASDLMSLYGADAVYAVQKLHVYVFEPIHEAIEEELFGQEWETTLTHNELAMTLVKTIEDFLENDLQLFLDGFLVRKAVDGLVTASVNFYVRCLLQKSDQHNSHRMGCFGDNALALDRYMGDVKLMREFFEGLGEKLHMRTLDRLVEKEFAILYAIHEFMSIAATQDVSETADFVIVLHKHIRNVDLTKRFVGDLIHMVSPAQEKVVWELAGDMEMTLEAIAPKSEESIREAMDNRLQVPGLRLDRVMAELYLESKRKLPIKSQAFDKMLESLRVDWGQTEKNDK